MRKRKGEVCPGFFEGCEARDGLQQCGFSYGSWRILGRLCVEGTGWRR